MVDKIKNHRFTVQTVDRGPAVSTLVSAFVEAVVKSVLWMKFKGACGLIVVVLLLGVEGLAQNRLQTQVKDLPEPAAIPTDQFVKLHTLIKPQTGELRFQQIPWQTSVWEARRQAAQEGKPILVWSGSGGAPLGVC